MQTQHLKKRLKLHGPKDVDGTDEDKEDTNLDPDAGTDEGYVLGIVKSLQDGAHGISKLHSSSLKLRQQLKEVEDVTEERDGLKAEVESLKRQLFVTEGQVVEGQQSLFDHERLLRESEADREAMQSRISDVERAWERQQRRFADLQRAASAVTKECDWMTENSYGPAEKKMDELRRLT